MDTCELSLDRAKFEAVWQRVMADSAAARGLNNTKIRLPAVAEPPIKPAGVYEKPCGPYDELADLRKFMDTAASIARYCRQIACKCHGRINKTLSCIAEDECRHLKKLRAEYFVLTGHTYCPAESYPPVCTVSEALRNVYLSETLAAEEYLSATEKSRSGLANTYRQFAMDEQQNARDIVCLIENMIC